MRRLALIALVGVLLPARGADSPEELYALYQRVEALQKAGKLREATGQTDRQDFSSSQKTISSVTLRKVK